MGKLLTFFDRHRIGWPDARRSLWFEDYEMTPEDVRFVESMRKATLIPTLVRLPSGRTVTGDELRQWYVARPAGAPTGETD
jgi:hypothetical protein